MIEYFVIAAGRSGKDPDGEISLVVANNVREAHDFVATHYRKQRNLASSVHVTTTTLHRGNSEEKAHTFLDRLFELMEKRKNEVEPSS